MSIIQGNAKRASVRGFYPKDIEGSLRFNDDDSAYLSWTPASAGNRKTWTWSGWVKRAGTGTRQWLFSTGTSGSNYGHFMIDSDDKLYYVQETPTLYRIGSNQKLRDHSAWYHIMFVMDTTNATADDRMRYYVNGVRVDADALKAQPPQNTDMVFNQAGSHSIGKNNYGTNYTDSYLAEVHFTDGTAYTADDFGELKNGVWVAKEPDVTYGTNGFYLNFQDDTEVEAFNTVIWSGDDVSGRQVTGVGFNPDLVWTKSRSSAVNHVLMDSVRGPNLRLESNTTDAEDVYDGINSFDSDGFSVGVQTGVNDVGKTYVAWCWDAGANNASTGHSSVTWTGSSATQKISGLPFRPDLVWIKARNVAYGSQLFDSVRGANKRLSSNVTNAEVSDTDALMSFDSDGFILGAEDGVNDSTYTYVGWGWDAGDSDPVSNTDGSITSTVKSNGDFSIISYQGTLADANIGHGLSSAPDMIIIKNRNRSAGTPWVVYHSSVGASQRTLLNDIAAASSSGNIFGSTPTAPDATKFYVGNVNWVNNNVSGENDHIAYAWRNVTGKQKFDTYEGNNTATGPAVNVGFRPGFVMIKNADGTGN